MKDEKEVFQNGEADAWFLRNYEAIENRIKTFEEPSPQYKSVLKYLLEQGYEKKTCNLLEVGCSYGYNLSYLSKKLVNSKVFGIEPSKLAVKKAVELYGDSVNVQQGTSDSLPFPDEMFDVCILGFCMLWVDRKYLFRTVSEADRILKSDGHLIIIDFDTKIPYIRDNIHNPYAYTYKMQYEKLFLANPQYSCALKESFSHGGRIFVKDTQERVSLTILYKDTVENAYIKG